MLATLLLAAESTKSKTPFYILAGLLILFAATLSARGITRHETFPPSRGMATLLIATCAVLVLGTMATAVITA
jgi:hypothetical protein